MIVVNDEVKWSEFSLNIASFVSNDRENYDNSETSNSGSLGLIIDEERETKRY